MKHSLRTLALGKRSGFACSLVIVLSSLVLFTACSSSSPPLTGNALTYRKAKDSLKKGNLDEALDYTDGLVSSASPNEFTDRARVLRIVILSGQVSGLRNLAESFQRGAEKTQNAHLKGEYRRLAADNLHYCAKRALQLGETALQIMHDGAVPKELTLEAPYPSAEGPNEVAQLTKVMDGIQIQPEDQETAATDAQRKGIDDTFADLIGGDRSKARSQFTGGPVKISGTNFALFLTRQLLAGASAFDHKHMHDPQKFTALHEAAQKSVAAAETLLKDSPNADQEKEIEKLQDQLKTALKEK